MTARSFLNMTIGAAILLVALGCGQPLFTPPPPRPPHEPPEPYFAPPTNASEIAEISWGRGACLGSCPVYTASFSTTGVARWQGEFPARYAGGDTSGIAPDVFQRLGERIIAEGFFELDHRLSADATDLPSLTIEVRLADGRTKSVSGTGAGHQLVGLVLDSTAQTLTWRRADRPFEDSHSALVYLSTRRATQDSAPR